MNGDDYMSQKKTIKKKDKPVLNADPKHNSFVYASDRLTETDKKRRPLGAKFISRTFKKPAFMVFLVLLLPHFSSDLAKALAIQFNKSHSMFKVMPLVNNITFTRENLNMSQT